MELSKRRILLNANAGIVGKFYFVEVFRFPIQVEGVWDHMTAPSKIARELAPLVDWLSAHEGLGLQKNAHTAGL